MTNDDKKSVKNVNRFYCDTCDYKCCNKNDYARHLATRKHEMMTRSDAKSAEKPYCCPDCNKSYKHRQGLFTHRKTCKPNKVTDASSNDYMTIISQLLNQNNELKNFIIEQASEHKKDTLEIVNKVIENVKPSTTNNNTINGNVNNNQKFNINVFLNEQCKDAMNFSDFIKNIEVSREDLENNAQLGFVNGFSKILIEHLKQLDKTERPIHCTDIKRETMYIKDEDKWSKEEDPTKINNAIQEVTRKSMRTLLNWKAENPDYKDNDSEFSNLCLVIQKNSMAAHNRDTYFPKVAKAVAKEVIIDK
jgi:transposase-like protein